MDELVWSVLDNSTRVLPNAYVSDAAFNSTIALSTTLRSPAGDSVSIWAVTSVGLIISSIGLCANSVVLGVLVRARRQFGSSVNTLISNQSAMDLFACVSLMLSIVFLRTDGYKHNGSEVANGAICFIFEAGTLAAVGLTAGNIGLMVITLERYFKIVHAIAHRKYYKKWMTSVGVALPWIGATCLVLFPAMGTTRYVNGRCLRLSVWPNVAMASVSLHLCLIFSKV